MELANAGSTQYSLNNEADAMDRWPPHGHQSAGGHWPAAQDAACGLKGTFRGLATPGRPTAAQGRISDRPGWQRVPDARRGPQRHQAWHWQAHFTALRWSPVSRWSEAKVLTFVKNLSSHGFPVSCFPTALSQDRGAEITAAANAELILPANQAIEKHKSKRVEKMPRERLSIAASRSHEFRLIRLQRLQHVFQHAGSG